nr:MAG TPA: hypothetical protein [Caudoviricetes sp.]
MADRAVRPTQLRLPTSRQSNKTNQLGRFRGHPRSPSAGGNHN